MTTSKKKYKAVIACGGFGKRLKDITKDLPKPIYPINGKSTLERSIEQLFNYSIDEVLITIGYKSNKFINLINNLKKKYKITIDIFEEEFPLGGCGALWHVKNKLDENFIFINGDLIFSIDFERLINFHKRLSSEMTLVTHTSDHPNDSDLVSTPNGTLVEDVFMKNLDKKNPRNAYLGNSGIFIINKSIIQKLNPPSIKDSSSIFHFIVRKMLALKLRVYSYNTTEYIKDMGTPSRLKMVQNDLKNNVVEIKNYRSSQKVLFLDRDNTLIKCEVGKYIVKISDVEFLDENISKISLIAKKYNFVCMVTNQPSISMGNLSMKKLDQINSLIIKYCLSRNLKIDVVTFCPHHPHKGFINEISYLKKDCFCRKPNPGLFLEQAFLRNINLSNSLMIGDSNNDLLAAKNANCNFKNIDSL